MGRQSGLVEIREIRVHPRQFALQYVQSDLGAGTFDALDIIGASQTFGRHDPYDYCNHYSGEVYLVGVQPFSIRTLVASALDYFGAVGPVKGLASIGQRPRRLS